MQTVRIEPEKITDIPSLSMLSHFKKPMVISPGIATLEEIAETVMALRQAGTI